MPRIPQRIVSVALMALVAIILLGCGGVQQAAQRQKRANKLKQIGLAYHSYLGDMNKAPSRTEDLQKYLPDDPTTYPALQSGQYVVLWGATQAGPMVLPGTYQAKLTVDGKTLIQSFDVKKNAHHAASDADLQAQYDLAIQIRDKVNEANAAIINIRRIKQAYRILFRSQLSLREAVDRVRQEVGDDPDVEHMLRFIEASTRGVARAGASRSGDED